jgi:Domain of unknown function (DUF5658)
MRNPGSRTPQCRPEPARGSGRGAVQGWPRRWPASRACWLLPVLFIGLQVADVVSTNYALAIPGIWEANPLMALAQAKLGAIWWLPKLAVAGLVCAATPMLRRPWPMLAVVAYYVMVVSINIAQL